VVTLFQTLHTLSYVAADRLSDRLAALKNDEKGATAVEYAILVGVLAVIIAAAVTAFGGRIKTLFEGIKFA
jgi:pilus assembly protein Flp/PilA